MSVKSEARSSGMATAAALICAAFLAACSGGDDTDRTNEIVRDIVLQRLSGGDAPPPRTTPEQIRQVVENTTQPLVLIDFAQTRSNAVIIEIGRNGPVQTYATSARQTVSLQNGLVRGTRGLGGDLMSVDLGSLPRMIAQRHGGTSVREMRVLNGEDITDRYRFACTVDVNAPTGQPSITPIYETCYQQNGDIHFVNSYQVDASGRVLKSEQWISPTLGSAGIQQLRF